MDLCNGTATEYHPVPSHPWKCGAPWAERSDNSAFPVELQALSEVRVKGNVPSLLNWAIAGKAVIRAQIAVP